jgi:peptidoglycan/xylan/chitin deacetylase (PgdA/CDA1 family)
MQAIADAGIPVITLDEYLMAIDGNQTLAPRSVIVTFDDGFTDFADAAWPVMSQHGFRPIVYLPTNFIGGVEGWRGIASPPRALMGWDQVRDLSKQGVLFGSHTINHPDLNGLSSDALREELAQSQKTLSAELGTDVLHFAPPYGLARPDVRRQIASLYRTSVGTALGQAGIRSDPINLPRLEMFYYTDIARWRRHLAGQGASYLAKRKALRAIKGAMMRPWRGI